MDIIVAGTFFLVRGSVEFLSELYIDSYNT
jgi:hypothetical protein